MTEYTYEAYLLSQTGRTLADVIDATLTEDTGWLPRFSGTVTVVSTPTLLDPDAPPQYVRLRFRRVGGRAIPLSEWSLRWGGNVAAYTVAGHTSPASITTALGGDTSAPAPEETEIELMVRDLDHDLLARTTTLSLTSCEMILEDLRRLIGSEIPLDHTSLQALVTYMVDRTGIAGVEVVESPDGRVSLLPDSLWSPGQTILDVLREHLEAADMILWASSRTEYHLTPRTPRHQATHLFDPDTLIDAHYVNNLADANATGSLEYRRSDDGTNTYSLYRGNAPGILVGDYQERRIRAATGGGIISGERQQPRRKRTGSRLRAYNLTAPSQYGVSADDNARVTIPTSGIDIGGTVAAVTHHYPGGASEYVIESAARWT